jgi:predicted enzyme related to lactoylglutathione lyase
MKKFALLAVLVVAPLVGAVLAQPPEGAKNQDSSATTRNEKALKVHYLEIVTPSVNETCDALEKAHGVTFGKPIAELGNARTAKLKDGGRMGVRAPMRKTEEPVVRPYVLVDDIEAALKAAEAAGAKAAMRPTKIPGHGTFAIYVLGGIDHGLWKL